MDMVGWVASNGARIHNGGTSSDFVEAWLGIPVVDHDQTSLPPRPRGRAWSSPKGVLVESAEDNVSRSGPGQQTPSLGSVTGALAGSVSSACDSADATVRLILNRRTNHLVILAREVEVSLTKVSVLIDTSRDLVRSHQTEEEGALDKCRPITERGRRDVRRPSSNVGP